jgi:hypothetical protein
LYQGVCGGQSIFKLIAINQIDVLLRSVARLLYVGVGGQKSLSIKFGSECRDRYKNQGKRSSNSFHFYVPR